MVCFFWKPPNSCCLFVESHHTRRVFMLNELQQTAVKAWIVYLARLRYCHVCLGYLSIIHTLALFILRRVRDQRSCPLQSEWQPAEKPADGSHQFEQQRHCEAIPWGTFPVSLPSVWADTFSLEISCSLRDSSAQTSWCEHISQLPLLLLWCNRKPTVSHKWAVVKRRSYFQATYLRGPARNKSKKRKSLTRVNVRGWSGFIMRKWSGLKFPAYSIWECWLPSPFEKILLILLIQDVSWHSLFPSRAGNPVNPPPPKTIRPESTLVLASYVPGFD